eukprot:5180197-Pleurochrysis_carterae.AAC.2
MRSSPRPRCDAVGLQRPATLCGVAVPALVRCAARSGGAVLLRACPVHEWWAPAGAVAGTQEHARDHSTGDRRWTEGCVRARSEQLAHHTHLARDFSFQLYSAPV